MASYGAPIYTRRVDNNNGAEALMYIPDLKPSIDAINEVLHAEEGGELNLSPRKILQRAGDDQFQLPDPLILAIGAIADVELVRAVIGSLERIYEVAFETGEKYGRVSESDAIARTVQKLLGVDRLATVLEDLNGAYQWAQQKARL
jgi:hypothetical protein